MMIENLGQMKPCKNDSDNKFINEAIEAGKDWLDNYDYDTFGQKLSAIAEDTSCQAIKDELERIAWMMHYTSKNLSSEKENE